MSDLRAARIRELGGRRDVAVLGKFEMVCDPLVLHVWSRQYPGATDACCCGAEVWAGRAVVVDLKAEG